MKISQMERVVPLVQKKQPKERVWKKAKDIAEYFGVSLATISKWTNSKNDPLPSRRVRGVLQYDFELVKECEAMRTVFKMTVKSALLMCLVAIILTSINPAYALIYWGTLVVVTAVRESFKMPTQKRPTSDGRR